MAKLTININPVFIEEKTDLSKCHFCSEIIYGKMYRLWIMPFNAKLRFIGSETDILACESCSNLLK